MSEPRHRKIVLIGNPNVGKSVIFRLLTGSYVMVSNFPGTTVEISRGELKLAGSTYEVVDTPGIQSLVPQSEDERVSCEVLLEQRPDLVVQVADAKNLRRTLLITSQLAEFGIPMILVLNMMDEAEERGIKIDALRIAELFSIPVIEMVAIYSQGRKKLLQAVQSPSVPRNVVLEQLAPEIRSLLPQAAGVPVALASQWLDARDGGMSRHAEAWFAGSARRFAAAGGSTTVVNPGREVYKHRNRLLDELVPEIKTRREIRFVESGTSAWNRIWLALLAVGVALFAWHEAATIIGLPTLQSMAQGALQDFLSQYLLRGGMAETILLGERSGGEFQFGILTELLHLLLVVGPVVIPCGLLLSRSRAFAHEVGVLTRRASTGLPILVLVLLLIYEFVGYTGAQTLVGLLEELVFGRYLTPAIQAVLPSGILYDLFVGPYGLFSMGVTYAIAIVLPVVGTFFIAFGLLEDSGYLPRLTILTDRVMRIIGLNGKATLPMILGLGCCTMATMTTRILNSRKERIIATLLLALGIPCSAQLGVILGIAAGFSAAATLTVVGVVFLQILLVGALASSLVRGTRSEFIFEIPPIRMPQLRNVLLKTGHRIRWYLLEAVPLFLYGTAGLFVLDRVHAGGRSLLGWIEAGLQPVLSGVLHLPAQAASVFVLGFLRRDYGAAGLYSMARAGQLDAQQVVVCLIVITLFVPCVATFLVIVKEHGLKRALAITAFIVPFAIAVGAVVSWVLRTFAVKFQ